MKRRNFFAQILGGIAALFLGTQKLVTAKPHGDIFGRRDPKHWHTLPLPVQYRALGSRLVTPDTPGAEFIRLRLHDNAPQKPHLLIQLLDLQAKTYVAIDISRAGYHGYNGKPELWLPHYTAGLYDRLEWIGEPELKPEWID